MNKIVVKASSGTSQVLLGGSIDDLAELCGSRKTLVITDTNVHRFHGSRFPEAPLVVIEPGEDSKDLHTVRTMHLKGWHERLVHIQEPS